jgi:hypothetical protein
MHTKKPFQNKKGDKKVRKFIAFGLFMTLITCSFHFGEELTIRKTTEKSDLPEDFCTSFEVGDYLVSDGKYLVLIGGSSRMLPSILNYPAADAMGSIIGFVPAGKDLVGDMIAGTPSVWIDEHRLDVKYTSVQTISEKEKEGAMFIQAVAPLEGEHGEKAQIITEYRFMPLSGKIGLNSRIKNTGDKRIEGLNFVLYFNANHSYSFSPFHREDHASLNFRIYPKKGHFLGFLNQNPLNRNEVPVPGILDPGESFDVQHMLLVDSDGDKLLEDIYQILEIPVGKAQIYFEDRESDLTEIIVRDILSHSIFFRSFLSKPFALEIPLPSGLYSVTANFFPAVEEQLFRVETDRENRLVLRDPPKGMIHVKIRSSDGEYVPGKVTVIGLDPTKSPYFKPENPMETGRRWETFKNSCFPGKNGLEVRLPVGEYLVCASRGPEYTMASEIVQVLQDETEELVLQIDKVIQTENLISVDPHMHTIYSDGTVDIAERIRSVVAEGVDVAIATDHNYINDYRPTLERLGLDNYLATIVGNEVTTGGVIHYNTYPLSQRINEPNNGAIYPHRKTATPLFQDSRKKDPEAILQVNHPRSGTIGYFNNFSLDPESAATAHKDLDLDFDVLEALNGPYVYSSNEQAIADWLNLMNRGYYFPIVASSDSHSIDRGQPGYSRTYVYYDGGEGNNLDARSVIQAMKNGHSFATNGPILDFRINGTHIPGDRFTDKDGEVDIWIRVESAPWISVAEVRLIINGKRKIIFPIEESSQSVVKFSGRISLPIEKDCYIAAEVMGNKSLFPVHQARARYGLRKNATLPYAVTNPVFIDVDGNGKFDPPLPKSIEMIEASKTEMRDEPGN